MDERDGGDLTQRRKGAEDGFGIGRMGQHPAPGFLPRIEYGASMGQAVILVFSGLGMGAAV